LISPVWYLDYHDPRRLSLAWSLAKKVICWQKLIFTIETYLLWYPKPNLYSHLIHFESLILSTHTLKIFLQRIYLPLWLQSLFKDLFYSIPHLFQIYNLYDSNIRPKKQWIQKVWTRSFPRLWRQLRLLPLKERWIFTLPKNLPERVNYMI
jgi:hypothetical protein